MYIYIYRKLTAICHAGQLFGSYTVIRQQYIATEHNSQVNYLAQKTLLNDTVTGRKEHLEKKKLFKI